MTAFPRTALFGAALALLAPAQKPDLLIGTWKLNVGKSTYSPGPPPTSTMVTFETVEGSTKVTAVSVDAQGNRTEVVYTAKYDGKDYPVTGSSDYDTVSMKRLDARTVESIRKKSGKVVQTVHRVVAEDGKSYTSRAKGTNAKGQPTSIVALFEKQ